MGVKPVTDIPPIIVTCRPVTWDPVPASERIEPLDVLRGFALFGILLVNMEQFGWPVYQVLLAEQPSMAGAYAVGDWIIGSILIWSGAPLLDLGRGRPRLVCPVRISAVGVSETQTADAARVGGDFAADSSPWRRQHEGVKMTIMNAKAFIPAFCFRFKPVNPSHDIEGPMNPRCRRRASST
jgi:hypothetical protein